MSAWYYESNNEHIGPVDEDQIRARAADGTITSATLVWHREFGNEWRAFGTTALYTPDSGTASPDGPPPLPGSGMPNSGDPLADDFLRSDLTRRLIGTKQDYYLGKWAKMLAAAKGDPALVVRKRSWNWPAFFVPYAWLFYRKLYLLGGLVIAIQFLFAFSDLMFPPALAKAMLSGSFGFYVVCGMYANGWYFDATYKKWLNLRSVVSEPEIQQFVAREGGARLAYGFGGAALVVIAIFAAVLTETASESKVSCSSSVTADTVARIAREQIDKDGYMMFVVDSKATKISVTAIRTKENTGAAASCAGNISYAIAFKAGASDPTIKTALEQTLKKDITYKVERTDAGDDIYVTVFGLQ